MLLFGKGVGAAHQIGVCFGAIGVQPLYDPIHGLLDALHRIGKITRRGVFFSSGEVQSRAV